MSHFPDPWTICAPCGIGVEALGPISEMREPVMTTVLCRTTASSPSRSGCTTFASTMAIEASAEEEPAAPEPAEKATIAARMHARSESKTFPPAIVDKTSLPQKSQATRGPIWPQATRRQHRIGSSTQSPRQADPLRGRWSRLFRSWRRRPQPSRESGGLREDAPDALPERHSRRAAALHVHRAWLRQAFLGANHQKPWKPVARSVR